MQVAGPYEHLVEAAAFASQRGMVALGLPDHYLLAMGEEEAKTKPANDAFVQMGGLARETQDLELVMLVSPITFRHPAVLAKSAVTLDLMSGGRFKLGVGTGWMDREHEVFGFNYPDLTERYAMLEDALNYLDAAFDPEFPGYEGERYQLKAFPLAPAPNRRIPILIGGIGAVKTPKLAGRYADEFNVYPGNNLAEKIDRFRIAAVDAGRDPDSVLLSSSGQVIAAETQSDFDELMNQDAVESGISREELDAHYNERGTPRGTFDQVNEQLDEFKRLGIGRFYFQGVFTPTDTAALLDGLGID